MRSNTAFLLVILIFLASSMPTYTFRQGSLVNKALWPSRFLPDPPSHRYKSNLNLFHDATTIFHSSESVSWLLETKESVQSSFFTWWQHHSPLVSNNIAGSVADLGDAISDGTASADSVVKSSEEVESGGLNILGKDLFIFLCATIGIVPLFRVLNSSPVLGFLSAGLLMGPAGLKLFSDLDDMERLADFGVLFLLFEQGLELTVNRIKSVSTFAFGYGSLQMLLCTVAFFIFPFIGGVQFLEFFVQSNPNLVDIQRFDEAFVIGTALALSSSAFVLQILSEKKELQNKFGSAALGILLLQDIAVVPLLVLLPILESSTGTDTLSSQVTLLATTFGKALLGLSGILFLGGKFIRKLFKIVSSTKSSETFVALCLLVVIGVGSLTDKLGLSSTLGAFIAGTLLAESNYRIQIEKTIQPFKGLLLGLFFLTTGASVDPQVITNDLPTVAALLFGLIVFKSVIIAAIGPFFKLTRAESAKLGMLLSGGGEFAFVILTLADRLEVIPSQLAKILVGVVVLSMAFTPTLSIWGEQLAKKIEEFQAERGIIDPNAFVSFGDGTSSMDNLMHDDEAQQIPVTASTSMAEVNNVVVATPIGTTTIVIPSTPIVTDDVIVNAVSKTIINGVSLDEIRFTQMGDSVQPESILLQGK